MLKAKLAGLPFARLLLDDCLQTEILDTQKKVQYLFLVLYKKIDSGTLPGFRVQARQTALIDLRPGIEKVFQNFKDNTRNEVRRGQKEAGLLFVNLDTNFSEVYRCYKKFERARHWIPTPKSEMKQHLIFSAYYKNKVVSGITCYGHKDILRVAKIFSARYDISGQDVSSAIVGYASRTLVFQICKYAIENGYTRLDLGGVNFTDPEKKGISQFKMSFGADIVDTSICRHMTPLFEKVKKIYFLFKKDIA